MEDAWRFAEEVIGLLPAMSQQGSLGERRGVRRDVGVRVGLLDV